MKKTICITPVDKTIRGWAEALYILNEFKRLGYTKREVFIAVMVKTSPEYNDYKKVQQLHHFWAMRDRSPELLKDIEAVLNTISKN